MRDTATANRAIDSRLTRTPMRMRRGDNSGPLETRPGLAHISPARGLGESLKPAARRRGERGIKLRRETADKEGQSTKGAYREIRIFVSCYRRFSCVVLPAAVCRFVRLNSASLVCHRSPSLARMRAYAFARMPVLRYGSDCQSIESAARR
jgi:hypothetical protein